MPKLSVEVTISEFKELVLRSTFQENNPLLSALIVTRFNHPLIVIVAFDLVLPLMVNVD